MSKVAALLRAVNVGGTGKLPMAELRSTLEAAGYDDVSTILQSGNVVLSAPSATPPQLEQELAEIIARQNGVATDVFVRTTEDWSELTNSNPFPEQTARHPSAVLVHFARELLDTELVARVQAENEGNEQLRVIGRHLFVTYPDGIAGSKLDRVSAWKAFPKATTARNWNTVLKIAERLGVPS